MAEPKKRITSTRSGNRRSQINMKALNLTECTKCKTKIMPHTVCYICGTYKGEKIINVDKEKKKSVGAEEEHSHEH